MGFLGHDTVFHGAVHQSSDGKWLLGAVLLN